MSTGISIKGYRPPDEHWQKMKAIFDACEAADVEPPEEVRRFFHWERPDPAGIQIDLEQHLSVADLKEEMVDGYKVNLKDLPENIQFLIFRVHY